MAYSQNWNRTDKVDYEGLTVLLTSLVVDITDNPFAIKKSSDDGGTTVEVWIEGGLQDKTQPRLPPQCKGWRVVWVSCPSGYIDAFEIRR